MLGQLEAEFPFKYFLLNANWLRREKLLILLKYHLNDE